MANISAVEAKDLSDQGIKGAKNVEWIQATFAGNIAADTITYQFRKIKSVGKVIGPGFSYTISGKTITFTLPYAVAAGTAVFGLVEG